MKHKHTDPEWFVLVELPDISLPQRNIVIGKRNYEGWEGDLDVDLWEFDDYKSIADRHLLVDGAKRTIQLAAEVHILTYLDGKLMRKGRKYMLEETTCVNAGTMQLHFAFVPSEDMDRRAYCVEMADISWMTEEDPYPWTPWNTAGRKLTDLEIVEDIEVPNFVMRQARSLKAMSISEPFTIRDLIEVVESGLNTSRNYSYGFWDDDLSAQVIFFSR
jgi:hypothetical protein